MQAFGGEPWNETHAHERIANMVREHMAKPGFSCLVDMQGTRVRGATWYDTPTLAELARERPDPEKRGAELVAFAEDYQHTCGACNLIWGRETVTHPDFAGQGVAKGLRKAFVDKVNQQGHTLVLTRMRSDNHAILHLARQLGYRPTGITMPAKETREEKPWVYHEYWFYSTLTSSAGTAVRDELASGSRPA